PEYLVGAATDTEDADIAIMTLHLGLADVACAAVELHRLVDDPFGGVDRRVLRQARFGDHVLPRNVPCGDLPDVGTRHVDTTCHLHQLVLYQLSRHQRPAETLPHPAPVHGDVQCPLRGGIG